MENQRKGMKKGLIILLSILFMIALSTAAYACGGDHDGGDAGMSDMSDMGAMGQCAMGSKGTTTETTTNGGTNMMSGGMMTTGMVGGMMNIMGGGMMGTAAGAGGMMGYGGGYASFTGVLVTLLLIGLVVLVFLQSYKVWTELRRKK